VSTISRPTSTPSIPVPRVSANQTPTSKPSIRTLTASSERPSLEHLSRPSARALPLTTTVAPSPTPKEVLVLPSTWIPVVSLPRFGIRRTLLSGDSTEPRSLKTSRTVTLTQTVGELPLLCGPKARAIFLPHSITSVVRTPHTPPFGTQLSNLRRLPVVINISICGDWAGSVFSGSYGGTCADAVANSTNFDCTSLPFLFFFQS